MKAGIEPTFTETFHAAIDAYIFNFVSTQIWDIKFHRLENSKQSLEVTWMLELNLRVMFVRNDLVAKYLLEFPHDREELKLWLNFSL